MSNQAPDFQAAAAALFQGDRVTIRDDYVDFFKIALTKYMRSQKIADCRLLKSKLSNSTVYRVLSVKVMGKKRELELEEYHALCPDKVDVSNFEKEVGHA